MREVWVRTPITPPFQYSNTQARYMGVFKLKQGYDIRLAGDAPDGISDAPYPASVALHPTAFRGIRPKLAVTVGDKVKAGSPLFFDKGNEAHTFASPASGTVTAVNRGARRALETVVIEIDEEAVRRLGGSAPVEPASEAARP